MRSEMGGIASLAGLFYRPIKSTRGAPRPRRDRPSTSSRSSPPTSSRPRSCASRRRTTAPAARRLPLDYHGQAARSTAENGVPLHIDGARVFNAAVAQGCRCRRSRQARRQRRLLRIQGPQRAVRVGAVRLPRRSSRRRAPIAAWSAAACARLASWRPPALSRSRAWSIACRRSPPRAPSRRWTACHRSASSANPNTVETNIVMVEIGHLGTDAKSFMATLTKARRRLQRVEPQVDPPGHASPHRRCGGGRDDLDFPHRARAAPRRASQPLDEQAARMPRR